MIYSLIISLSLTIVFELSMSLILGIRNSNDILVCVLVNTCTNPVVVFIANLLYVYGNNTIYNIVVILMEITVVIVEFILYRKFLQDYKKSPFVLSLINNFFSYTIGLLLF